MSELNLYSVQIKWRRIILDEAHNIKDRRSSTAKAVFALDACYRWALSGTPLQVCLLLTAPMWITHVRNKHHRSVPGFLLLLSSVRLATTSLNAKLAGSCAHKRYSTM